MPGKPTVVSLFSGAGGLDIGLEQSGWEIAVATDHARYAMETLRQTKELGLPILGGDSAHLANTRLVEADVRDLDSADLKPTGASGAWTPDLVVGGPPCQPWSSAGLQRGLDDPRGQLIGHFLRLIGELRPRFVLFENVRGLVTARGATGAPGEVLRSIQDDLQLLGYGSRVATLNAADFGSAQRRVRLVLIAASTHALPEFPAPTHSKDGQGGLFPWVTLGEFLESLPNPSDSEIVRPTGQRSEVLRSLRPGTGIKTAGKVMANRPSGQWGYRQDGFLADLALPARTIRAASSPDWVRVPGDEDLRRLSWRECAALQGFPAEWAFSGTTSQKFRQIGNAVQVDMARVVGRQILESLNDGLLGHQPDSPPWPADLVGRIRYTQAEARVNGHLRSRAGYLGATG